MALLEHMLDCSIFIIFYNDTHIHTHDSCIENYMKKIELHINLYFKHEGKTVWKNCDNISYET